jgi:MraZ protein
VFLGTHEHTIDSKGRLAIPAKYRPDLESGMIITRSIDKCLALYPIKAFEEKAAKYRELPSSDMNARNLQRGFFASAVDCDIDKQGRIIIPAELREYAGIGTDNELTAIIGNDTFIEIWNKERWLKVQQQFEENGDAMASAVTNFGVI